MEKDEHQITRPLGILWVLKIKDNGRYRSRLSSKGFLQREGLDYDLSNSPFICDITSLTILIYHVKNTSTIMVSIYIKKDLLESNIEEDIYFKKNTDILKKLDSKYK